MAFNSIIDYIPLSMNLLIKILIAIVVLIASYYIGVLVGNYIRKVKLKAPPEVIYNLARTAKYLILFLGFLTALSVLGVELSGLLIAAGFTGIVVGLAAQQTLSQLFAGISLILEGRARVGDAIRIGDDWGLVESVGLMSTQIRLWSGEILTIPNDSVMGSKIYNYSRSVARRIDLTIGISYTSDINKALSIITSLLNEKELILAEPPPTLIVDSLGDSAVIIKVLLWVPSSEFWTVRREIIREIKEALEAEGIEIPFPQRVVWLRSVAGSKGT